MTRLPQIIDGEWQRPVHRGYVVECCQCCARHVMDFRVRKGSVEFRATRIKQRAKKC